MYLHDLYAKKADSTGAGTTPVVIGTWATNNKGWAAVFTLFMQMNLTETLDIRYCSKFWAWTRISSRKFC